MSADLLCRENTPKSNLLLSFSKLEPTVQFCVGHTLHTLTLNWEIRMSTKMSTLTSRKAPSKSQIFVNFEHETMCITKGDQSLNAKSKRKISVTLSTVSKNGLFYVILSLWHLLNIFQHCECQLQRENVRICLVSVPYCFRKIQFGWHFKVLQRWAACHLIWCFSPHWEKEPDQPP